MNGERIPEVFCGTPGGMYRVELYAQVRRSVYVQGISEREAAQRFGLARETVRKMLRYATPPGYRLHQQVRRPKLGPFTGIIEQILDELLEEPEAGVSGRGRRREAVGRTDWHVSLAPRRRPG